MDSLIVAAARFAALAAEAEAIKHAALEEAAKEFLKRAQASLGTYEYGWPHLAESTIARKSRGDTPGLETGVMQRSGGYEVHGDTATVGFTDPKIVWFEFGTKHQPPRPVVGGTIDHHMPAIAHKMAVSFGMVIEEALVGGSVLAAISRALGR